MKNYLKNTVARHFKKIPALFATTVNVNDFIPLADLRGSRILSGVFNSGSLGDYIQSLFNLAIVFGGIIAVLRIAYGGFLYMTSDIADTKTRAKSIIMTSLGGLLLLLAIVLILRQINPKILNLDVSNLEQINAPQNAE